MRFRAAGLATALIMGGFTSVGVGAMPAEAAIPSGCTVIALGKTTPATCSYVSTGEPDPYAAAGSGQFSITWTRPTGEEMTGIGTMPKTGSNRAKAGTTVTVTALAGTTGIIVIGYGPTNVGMTPLDPAPANTTRSGAVDFRESTIGTGDICLEICAFAKVRNPYFHVEDVPVIVTAATTFTVANPNGGASLPADYLNAVWGNVEATGIEIFDPASPSGRTLLATAVHNPGGPASLIEEGAYAALTAVRAADGQTVHEFTATLHGTHLTQPFDTLELGSTAGPGPLFGLDVTCASAAATAASATLHYRDGLGTVADFDLGSSSGALGVSGPLYAWTATTTVVTAGPWAGHTATAWFYPTTDSVLCSGVTAMAGPFGILFD